MTTPSSPANRPASITVDTDALLDKAGKVRASETLDTAAVSKWLQSQGVDVVGEAEVSQYSGGASNWTYRLKYANADFILRRPPAGTKAKSAHDMVREYQVQKALAADYPYVPEMIALCTDPSVIGCDFYLMQRLEGIIPRSNLPKGLQLDEAQVRQLCTNVIDALIELHQIDYASNPELVALGKTQNSDKSYCQRQVLGWDKRYSKAKTPNVPSFYWVRQWLKRNLPSDSDTCVIHNDWRFDNVVLDPNEPTRVIGVLDWEMATLGDPLMDLGSALAYWVQADDNPIIKQSRRQPTHLKGMMSRDEVVKYYLEKTGMDSEQVLSKWPFYEVFGLFRLAGIAQQIYYRYYHKQTDNPAFKNFWIIIHALHARCLSIIAKHEAKGSAQRLLASDIWPSPLQKALQTLTKRLLD